MYENSLVILRIGPFSQVSVKVKKFAVLFEEEVKEVAEKRKGDSRNQYEFGIILEI